MPGYAVELRIITTEGRRMGCVVELKAADAEAAVDVAIERARKDYPDCSFEVADRPHRYRAAPRRPKLIRPAKVV